MPVDEFLVNGPFCLPKCKENYIVFYLHFQKITGAMPPEHHMGGAQPFPKPHTDMHDLFSITFSDSDNNRTARLLRGCQ